MSWQYHLRSNSTCVERFDDSDFSEPEAESSVAAPSSPVLDGSEDTAQTDTIALLALDSNILPEDDETDMDFMLPSRNLPRYTNIEKTLAVLEYFKKFSRFSIRTFLETLFSSDSPNINTVVGIFLENGGGVALMKLLWERERRGKRGEEIRGWIVERAAEICAKEFSLVTDRASQGPHYEDAKALRVPADRTTVSLARTFSFGRLLSCYERTLPHFQCILKTVIAKEGRSETENMRNPDNVSKMISSFNHSKLMRQYCQGRTMATSILLNLRSRTTNYHAAVNTMILWEQQASKKLVQILNRTGICSSYEYQGNAVLSLSRNSVAVARTVAADPTKLKMLSYDNFNWCSRAWESSASHGTIQHDEVSAMLVVLRIPPDLLQSGLSAEDLASLPHFLENTGQRHQLSPEQSLRDIIPSREDQDAFREAVELHVANILVRDTAAFTPFARALPSFDDTMAIEPHKTERHFLPTFDQEQGSTRGNMVVLTHYFLQVLRLPLDVFERLVFFICGDRLTTARDRAAQDQRAVDRSPFRVHHFSSFAMASGLMHQCLNMVINVGRNFWGGRSQGFGQLDVTS